MKRIIAAFLLAVTLVGCGPKGDRGPRGETGLPGLNGSPKSIATLTGQVTSDKVVVTDIRFADPALVQVYVTEGSVKVSLPYYMQDHLENVYYQVDPSQSTVTIFNAQTGNWAGYEITVIY